MPENSYLWASVRVNLNCVEPTTWERDWKAQCWLENKTFPTEEALLRFRHQLTRIHPFANGNGRHARMIADITAVKYGRAKFTWGAGKDLIAQGDARGRYLATLCALDDNENYVKPPLDFARS